MMNIKILDKKIEEIKDEINSVWQQDRIKGIINAKDYIEEKRVILHNGITEWNGEKLERAKVLLNYVDTLLNFESSFLLKNPTTLTSDDVECLEEYKRTYKRGKYNILDYRILESLVKYGEAFEYIYLDGDKVKSKILDCLECYPVYDRNGEYIRLIQSYSYDYDTYYIVYEKDFVTEYKVKDKDIEVVGKWKNLSGLPIRYVLLGEDGISPVSSLSRYANIIDSMEDLISRQIDTFNKYNNPIPILSGTSMSSGKGTIDSDVAGEGLQLQHDSSFSFINPNADIEMFDRLWHTLKNSLIEISQTPSILMSSSNLSNVSEETIKIMFSLAEVKAKKNEIALRVGFEERFKIFKRMLNAMGKGLNEDSYIDVIFNYNVPQSNSTIVEDITKAYSGGVMSLDNAVENNPYTNDVSLEMKRINRDKDGINDNDKKDDVVENKEAI